MFQDVFLLGTRTVGGTFINQVYGLGDTNLRHAHPTRMVGIANSKEFIYDENGIDEGRAKEFCAKRTGGRAYSDSRELIQVVNKGKNPNTVFIDATPSSKMLDFHTYVIDSTPFGIVTANKKPLVECDFETFRRLTKDPFKYGFRPSVMAGADAVYWLRKRADLNDPIQRMDGCVSGTCGFIGTGMDIGIKISDRMRKAIERQFAEPDFRDDMNGLDSARKVVIGMRASGVNVSMLNVFRRGFVPDKYLGEGSAEQLLEVFERELDGEYMKMAEGVAKKGEVIRYLGTFDASRGSSSLSLGLQSVPKDSWFGQLRDEQNRIIAHTPMFKPYDSGIIKGAGPEITAHNIRSDLIDLLSTREIASLN